DPDGNVYVIGSTQSTNFPGTSTSPIQNAIRYTGSYPGWDAFVTKLNPTGSAALFSTYLGGGGGDLGYAIQYRNGHLYVAGYTSSADFPGTATSLIQTTLKGLNDIFVTELKSD